MSNRNVRDRPRERNRAKRLFSFLLVALLSLGMVSVAGSIFEFSPNSPSSDTTIKLPSEEPEKLVVSNIEINEDTFTKLIFVNDELDISASEVTLHYTNGGKKVANISSIPEIEVLEIDTTTPGVKELTVSYESFFDTIEVYVAEADGAYSLEVNDERLIYTNADSLYIQSSSSNILSRPYYTDGLTKDENNRFIVYDYGDGIEVQTDGSISQTFSMQLYKGAPALAMSSGNYLSLGLTGYDESVWLCLKLWDGLPGTKLAQFVVKSGQYCNVDLSLYPDAKVWDVTLMVAPGAAVNSYVYPSLCLYAQGESIDSGVVHDGFIGSDSPSLRYELTPNELGIVDLSKYTGGTSYPSFFVVYVKAEQLSEELIYLIE